MSKVKLLLAGLIYLQVVNLNAQRSNYVMTDSSISIGVKILPGLTKENTHFIKVKDKNSIVVYTPDQIKEYGFSDGTVYESNRINLNNETKTVFLERITSGRVTLYKYKDFNKKKFFLKKDSGSLIEISKKLEPLMDSLADCKYLANSIKLTTFTKGSLTKLASHYNVCKARPFPYKKFGLLVGFRQLNLVKSADFRNELMSNIPIPSSNSAFVGIFADIPVRMTHFSLRSEITINNNNFVAAQSNIDGDTDVFITLLTVQSPVSIRYTLPTVIWRPFFNVGPNFSYNIKNTSSIYRTRIENNVIIIDKPVQYKLLSDYSIGYCLGLGFQYNLTYKKTISTEFRYCRTLTPSDNKLMQNSIDFLFGFTF